MLAVDREVELVGSPVLPLPERVELLVGHQPARPAGPGIAGVAAVDRRAPRARAGGLHPPLALLALQLGPIDALSAIDPAPEQRHRIDRALELGHPQPGGFRGSELATEELAPGRYLQAHDRIGLRRH